MALSTLSALLTLPLLAQLNFTAPLLSHVSDEDAERNYQPKYASLATGDLEKWQHTDGNQRYSWPVEVKSIGNSNASYQRYGSLSEAYFHHGLDIRAEAGSPVHAAVGGKVINIENYEPGISAYWEIAILDDAGFIWQYHHIDHDSIPQEIFDAFENKTSISTGATLGKVYYWMVVSMGERYHHIHLNILGKQKAYLSPFTFLEKLPDTSDPEIKEIVLTKNGSKVNGTQISGDYSIAAEVHDLVLSDRFILPPHELSISIDGQSPIVVWNFDTLPGGEDKKLFVNAFFVPKLACGDYECRRPVVDLGFNKTPQQIFPQARGRHEVEVVAKDYNGNSCQKRFSWDVE